jgi:cytochrome b6-f complex iron-sulfur subunit
MNWTEASIEQRREFLKSASSALGVAACGAFFVACENTTVKNPQDTTPSEDVSFIITDDTELQALTTVQSTATKSVDGFNSGFPILFIRTSATEIKAYSSACSHEGFPVNKTLENGKIYCSIHGSEFDPLTGNVLQGPAFRALDKFTTTFEPQTNKLTLKK